MVFDINQPTKYTQDSRLTCLCWGRLTRSLLKSINVFNHSTSFVRLIRSSSAAGALERWRGGVCSYTAVSRRQITREKNKQKNNNSSKLDRRPNALRWWHVRDDRGIYLCRRRRSIRAPRPFGRRALGDVWGLQIRRNCSIAIAYKPIRHGNLMWFVSFLLVTKHWRTPWRNRAHVTVINRVRVHVMRARWSNETAKLPRGRSSTLTGKCWTIVEIASIIPKIYSRMETTQITHSLTHVRDVFKFFTVLGRTARQHTIVY